MAQQILLALLLLLVGCASDRVALDPRWLPLEAIVEADLPLVPDTAITTVGTRCFVADLDAWRARHPDGSADLDAILLHEQAHAQRQAARGTTLWLALYLTDREFAWSEEQVGWAIELRHRRTHGALGAPEFYARILAGYRNAAGRLASYEDALAWVRAVLADP